MTDTDTMTPDQIERILFAANRARAGSKPCHRCKTPTHGVDMQGRVNCAVCSTAGLGRSVTPLYLKKFNEGKL